MTRTCLSIIFTSILFLAFFNLGAQTPETAIDTKAGGELFKQHCSACHKVDRKLVGPQLGGVNAKYANDREWLYKWVKNSPGLLAAKDEKAIALWEENDKAAMNAFTFLSNEEIDNILAWADEEIEIKNSGGGNNGKPPTETVIPPNIYYALLGLVALLALVALILVVITATLITAVRAKDEQEPITLSEILARTKAILSNKYVATAIVAFVLLGGTTKLIVEARTIGLHQGYMPEQPVKFSHELHAGQYEIDCKYCHSGVTKSKNAWIPSVNVCMNCHKYIQEGPKYGEEEIAKVVKAYEDKKPIEWVRIHNIPDHAYFNHAQHVVVGGLECQTCHGPVEEMEVVYQYSNLGMGWCISCHREEKVKVLGKENTEGLTVEDMGGLDCAKCHY